MALVSILAPRRTTALLAGAALIVTGCGDGKETSGPGEEQRGAGDSGPVHVHGLGTNPKDGSLYIATHTGLFRAGHGETRAERVGSSDQDTMGFTVLGRDRFLGSGHPGQFQRGPSLLGLIRSDNAGKNWQPVSLAGEADFHVLRSSHGRVFGFDSANGRLLVSRDGGESWEERPPPAPLIDLAIDPRDPRRLVAAGQGELFSSRDGGRRWRSLRGEPGLLAWPRAKRLYLVNAAGVVRMSSDAGRRWTPRGDIGGQPAALLGQAREDLYAALPDGTVKLSRDGGRSWAVRSRP